MQNLVFLIMYVNTAPQVKIIVKQTGKITLVGLFIDKSVPSKRKQTDPNTIKNNFKRAK